MIPAMNGLARPEILATTAWLAEQVIVAPGASDEPLTGVHVPRTAPSKRRTSGKVPLFNGKTDLTANDPLYVARARDPKNWKRAQIDIEGLRVQNDIAAILDTMA